MMYMTKGVHLDMAGSFVSANCVLRVGNDAIYSIVNEGHPYAGSAFRVPDKARCCIARCMGPKDHYGSFVRSQAGRSRIHVRSTPNSDRKFKAHLFVAMCHEPTCAID